MCRNKTFWVGTALLAAWLCYAGDWGSLGLQPERSRATTELMAPPFTLDWAAPLPSGGASSPVAADGSVVVGTLKGAVRAYRETTGSLLWQSTTGDEVIATPLLTRGRAYVPSTDRKTHVLRLADGVELPTIDTGGTEMSSPATDGTTVFMGLGFPNQHAAAFGPSPWQTPLEQLTYSSPALSGGLLFIGCNSGRYYCLNATNGALVWTFATAGSVLLSSPLVVGDHAYLLPGGGTNLLYRVHKDPAQWATNWTYAVPEPAATLPGLQMTRRPVSSPVRVNGLICFLMRFDQYHDTDANFVLDAIVMREYLVAVDTNGAPAPWSPILLASKTVPNPNRVPQLGLCPAPAVFTTPAATPMLAVASSLAPELRLYDASGTLAQTLALDSPTRASPTAANTHLYVATEQTLYAFRCANNTAPSPPAILAPTGNANVTVSTPDLVWSAASDDDAALTYILRVDNDGEILLDTDYEFTTTSTSLTLPPIPDDTQLTWAVRVQDPKGALSPWSTSHQFWVNRNIVPPAPPSNLQAVPGNAQVSLSWTTSPSTDVVGYWVSTKEGANPFGPYVPVGNVTTTVVSGLVNNTPYTFRVAARDIDGLQSDFVEASATPMYPVALNGAPFATLEAAALAALPGDMIQLGVGTIAVSGTVLLKGGVTLVGFAPHLTTISGPGLDRVIRIVVGDGPAIVRMLTVTGGLVGIDADANEIEVRNVILRHMNIGLLSPVGSSVQVVNCTIVYNSVAGLYTAPTPFAARNNILQKNEVGIYAEPGAVPALTYNNVVANFTADYSGCAPGAGSTAVIVPFVDEAAFDFREPDLSPNVDAGDPVDPFANEPAPNGGRINQGAFGNTAWAAKSPAPPPPPSGGGGGGGGGGCGLVGLDALLLLALIVLLRRARR